MKNDDYGFYGKGLDGYVHYRQGMDEAARNAPVSGGRRSVSPPQTETAQASHQSAEPLPIGTWIKRNPLHTACMVSWFIALTCIIAEDVYDVSTQFLTAAAIFSAIALILLGLEIVKFAIWFFKNF